MKKQDRTVNEATLLRLLAEEHLKNEKAPLSETEEIDNLKLIHELQVHQIELDMQNEELVLAKEKAERASEKYVDLYDFAPSGFLSLSKDGDIIDLNFSAAKLLGKDRIHLKKTRLGLHIHRNSLNTFNLLINNAFISGHKEVCELFLNTDNAPVICVYVEAIASVSNKECLVSMLDISERKVLEEVLLRTSQELKDMNKYFLNRELRMIDLKKEINELLIKSGCEKEYLI